MALSGSRLTSALAADILTQLQTQFPVPSPALQAGELTAFNTAQQKLATAIANASGPDIVTEITGHAALNVTVTSVSGVTAGGSSSGPGTGTGTIS